MEVVLTLQQFGAHPPRPRFHHSASARAWKEASGCLNIESRRKSWGVFKHTELAKNALHICFHYNIDYQNFLNCSIYLPSLLMVRSTIVIYWSPLVLVGIDLPSNDGLLICTCNSAKGVDEKVNWHLPFS